MLLGNLFTLLLGVIWAFIAIILLLSRRAKCQVEHFYVLSSLGAAALILAYQAATGTVIPAQWSWLTAACMVAGALMNALANYCTMINLGYGGAAIFFALGRIGFAFSFLWAVCFWGDKITVLNAIGLLALVAAVILTSMSKKHGGNGQQNYSHRCLLLALMSAGASAATHIFFIFPTTAACQAPPLPPMTKTLLIMATNIVVFGVVALVRKSREKPHYATLFKVAFSWSALAVLSYAVLFAALKYLGETGHSGVAYPVGGAIQILGLAIYTRCVVKEKLTRAQMVAMALILFGIFAIKL